MANGTIEIQAYESGLSVEKHNELANRFNPFMAEVDGLIQSAKGIVVADAKDRDGMASARKVRLALKAIRVDIEDTRKELKESALREGKAIDGMANIIKFVIVPVEQELKEKEDFVRRAEEKRISALAEERRGELESLDVRREHFDLGCMADEAYDALLSSSRLGYKAKKDAEAAERARIDAERVAAERAEADRREAERVERERIEAENARLKKAAAAAERDAAKARKKQESVRTAAEAKVRAAVKEAAALRKAEDDRQRQEAKDRAAAAAAEREAEVAKAKADKAAEQALLAAPDTEKLRRLADDVCGLNVPSVSSDIALVAVHELRGILNSAVRCLREAIGQMTDNGEKPCQTSTQ